MKKEDYRVLSINPGSKHIGFALFVNTELRLWKVKTFQYSKLENKIEAVNEIILKLSYTHDINAVIIKKLHPSRTSKNLQRLVLKIKNNLTKQGFNLFEYSLESVKSNILLNKKGNKNSLMEEIVSQYPILHSELKKELKNKNKYYIRMFEAVSLGMVFLNENL
jgi:RNase H-fold protein (predicted Holliday junction resolvase)